MSRKSYLEELLWLSVKELVRKRTELRKELFDFKMKNVTGSLKKNSDIRMTRRNIARVNTILTSKIAEQYGNSVK